MSDLQVLNKPYVWIQDVSAGAGQVMLSIRCRCGENLEINPDLVEDEITDADRLLLKFQICGSDIPLEEFTYTTITYDPDVHTKITVMVIDVDVPKGSCTVKPVASFFE